jgi:hypothetical protein
MNFVILRSAKNLLMPIKKAAIKTTPTIKSTVTSAKKKEKQTSPKAIKYSDKLEGQPQLVEIFDAIKALMKPYEKGSLKAFGEKSGMYHLVSFKPVEIAGRKRKELYFVSIMVQKGFVGFYYMAVYMNPHPEKLVQPELLKCLKGKACFHIKKNDPVIMKQIEQALEAGYNFYKERGWVD